MVASSIVESLDTNRASSGLTIEPTVMLRQSQTRPRSRLGIAPERSGRVGGSWTRAMRLTARGRRVGVGTREGAIRSARGVEVTTVGGAKEEVEGVARRWESGGGGGGGGRGGEEAEDKGADDDKGGIGDWADTPTGGTEDPAADGAGTELAEEGPESKTEAEEISVEAGAAAFGAIGSTEGNASADGGSGRTDMA